MKIEAQRTSMPFSGGRDSNGISFLSPTTNKSIMPSNNTPTIESILSGETNISDVYPHAGGDWSPGKDTEKDYKEKGDDYKREERDLGIIQKMLSPRQKDVEKWKIRVKDGFLIFDSFYLAEKYMSENKIPFKYITRIAQNESVKIVSEFINSVFMVESLDYAAGIKENGAAFCIAPKYFLTCAHVIKKYDKNREQNIDEFIGKAAPIISLIHDNKKTKATPIAVDVVQDIALLTADINVKPFEIDLDYKVGENILTIGSPHGYENNVSSGIMGSLNRKIYVHANAPTYTFIDLAVFPGSSGGPVIKESNGKVVGMVTLIISASGEYGLNAALPSNYIKQFCQKHLDIFK